jgi:hypothetical protein
MDQIKVSFCIVCMNRTHHLKQTLSKNMSDNCNSDMLEFLILDYNSGDDLELFIKETFSNEIASGKLL